MDLDIVRGFPDLSGFDYRRDAVWHSPVELPSISDLTGCSRMIWMRYESILKARHFTIRSIESLSHDMSLTYW